jgi:hypothetical protein
MVSPFAAEKVMTISFYHAHLLALSKAPFDFVRRNKRSSLRSGRKTQGQSAVEAR